MFDRFDERKIGMISAGTYEVTPTLWDPNPAPTKEMWQVGRLDRVASSF